MMTSREADLRVEPDADRLADAAARLFVDEARAAIAARGVFRVALAGGSTPRALYQRLARPADPALTAGVDWTRVHLFFGDERFVPSTDPDSNYRMVKETGLAGRTVPEAQVHRVPTELGDPQATADRYAEILREQFGLPAAQAGAGAGAVGGDGEWPRFDLVLLGMGEDGHTASLFPGTDVLHETRRIVAAVWVERMHTWRVTLTAPVLNHAHRVAMLVSGAGKAAMLANVLQGPWDPERWPVQGIRPGGRSPIWLVDAATAAQISRVS
jgi:6-phosphogluconolactonase